MVFSGSILPGEEWADLFAGPRPAELLKLGDEDHHSNAEKKRNHLNINIHYKQNLHNFQHNSVSGKDQVQALSVFKWNKISSYLHDALAKGGAFQEFWDHGHSGDVDEPTWCHGYLTTLTWSDQVGEDGII